MRVLIADDNQINREFVKGVLEGNDFRLAEAADGEEAVAICRESRFDAILMDIRMPQLDGIEATRQIRELAGYRDCPIIALTADLQLEKSRDLEQLGFSACLLKPVSRDRLLAMLQQQLDPDAAADPEDSKPAAASPVDRQAALAAAGGSEDLVDRLLQMLRVELSAFLPRIEQAIAGERWAEARDMAHKTRGSAGYTGAKVLQEAASQLELAITREQPSEIHQAFQVLKQAAFDLERYLQQRGAESGA
ncbi:MAG: response regulator [Xanthomonadales bacterium]|nr:response regulator [Xanthomonadales bacterium]